MDKNIQMHDYKNGFNRVFPISLDTNIFDKDGVSIKDSLINFKDVITQELVDFKVTMNDEIDNFIGQVDLKLNKIRINVKDYGVIGDGIVNDTMAIKSVFEMAILNDYIVYFPKGEYKIISDEIWATPKLVGDNAILNITGALNFKTVGSVHIEGLTVKATGNGGEDVNTITSNYILFSNNETSIVDYCYIKDLTIIGNIPRTKRLRTGVYLPESKVTRIDNLKGYNVVNLLITGRNSQNLFLNNIYGENIETLVNMFNPYNATLKNIAIKNIKSDSLWWMSQNTGRNYNGRDTVLIEGGSNVIMDNISGEWCIERVIYSQASDVISTNLTSINTGGFKFSGHQTDPLQRIKGIRATNLEIVRTDKDVRDSIGQVYGVEDLHIENITMRSYISDNINQHSISGNNGSIIINNLYVYGFRNPIFKKLLGVTDSLLVNNVYFKSVATGAIDGLLMVKDNNYTTVDDYINTITFQNVHVDISPNLTVRNIIYNPESNKIARKINIIDTFGIMTGASSRHMFGMETLIGAEYQNVTIRSMSGISFLGESMFEHNLLSNKSIRNLKIENIEDEQYASMIINKETDRPYTVLGFIKEMIYSRKNSLDNQFTFPIKGNSTYKIKIGDKTGYAEFSLTNNTITQIFNTGTHIQAGTGGVADKITLYLNGNGFLTVRNRISNNEFTATVINEMI